MIAPAKFPVARQRGSALLAALCFATVLAVALGSYLTLCYRTLALSSRALQGTQSVELAEAGMEDALWALNRNDWSGWTITGTTATRSLSGFTFAGGVTGSAQLTVTNYSGLTGVRTVTVTGTTQQPGGAAVSRTLTSTSARAALLVNAVAATAGRVRFKSAGSLDSYDSRLGDYASQTPGYAGVVSSGLNASGGGSLDAAAVELTSVQIKGYVAAMAGGLSYGTAARLLGPATPVGVKIDPTRISYSPYQPQFDEIVPSGSGSALPGGTVTLGNAGATVPAFYYASELALAGADVLTIDGPVVLAISGNVAISDTAKIRITATGSLRLHLTGTLGLNGNGIENDTNLPKKLVIISTTNSQPNYGMATNTPFCGVIYAPGANLTVYNSQTIFGALVARSVTFNASPVLHYDVALRTTEIEGVDAPFTVVDWRESTTGS